MKYELPRHFNLTKLYQQPKRPTSIDNDRPRAHTSYRSGASGSGGAMGFGKEIVTKFTAEGARVLVLDIMEPSPEEAQGDSSKNITCLRAEI
ncbi:alcohol dehydrogenase [Penicillium freii]|nr:alcohol dehydrogenase [Penicillium freii]